MVWACLFGAAALVGASSFSSTINLGAVLVGILIIVGFAWASRKDKRSDRWENLYHLADAERKEIQEKHSEAMAAIADLKEVNNRLEALQMPAKVMEVMTQSVKLLNEQAATRQEEIKQKVEDNLQDHEERAQERTQLIIETQDKLIDVINDLAKKIPPVAHGGL